jgi:hypothetical protein
MMKVVFYKVAPCIPVVIDRRFRGVTASISAMSKLRGLVVALVMQVVCISETSAFFFQIHGATTQKIAIITHRREKPHAVSYFAI